MVKIIPILTEKFCIKESQRDLKSVDSVDEEMENSQIGGEQIEQVRFGEVVEHKFVFNFN